MTAGFYWKVLVAAERVIIRGIRLPCENWTKKIAAPLETKIQFFYFSGAIARWLPAA
jgi:hypothetical protein